MGLPKGIQAQEALQPQQSFPGVSKQGASLNPFNMKSFLIWEEVESPIFTGEKTTYI